MIYAGLIAFFFLEYIRPTSYIPAMTALHLNSIIPLATAAGSFVSSGHATLSRMANDPNTRFVGAMLGLVWVSFLTSTVQMVAWDTLMVIAGFAIVYWVIGSEVTSTRKLKGLIVTLIIVHLIVVWLNPMLFTDPEKRHYLTSGSFLGDGNDFALSIVLIIPLCLYMLFDSKRTIIKLFWAGAVLLLVFAVVVTQSRGGTIGMVCMGLYFWAKSRKKLQTGLLIVATAALVLSFAPGNYFTRMRLISDTSEGSASARLTAWGAAVRMAVDSPLLGVGAGHFGMMIGTQYRPAGFVGAGMTAHSIYFLALGELGFPGFFLLLAYIGYNLRANQRLAKELKARASPTSESDVQLLAGTSAAIIGYASAGAFLSALYYPHFYVLGGILCAGRHVVRQRMVEAPTSASQPQASPPVSLHWALRPQPRPAVGSTLGTRSRIASRAIGSTRGRS